jgi:hypothetical protein
MAYLLKCKMGMAPSLFSLEQVLKTILPRNVRDHMAGILTKPHGQRKGSILLPEFKDPIQPGADPLWLCSCLSLLKPFQAGYLSLATRQQGLSKWQQVPLPDKNYPI